MIEDSRKIVRDSKIDETKPIFTNDELRKYTKEKDTIKYIANVLRNDIKVDILAGFFNNKRARGIDLWLLNPLFFENVYNAMKDVQAATDQICKLIWDELEIRRREKLYVTIGEFTKMKESNLQIFSYIMLSLIVIQYIQEKFETEENKISEVQAAKIYMSHQPRKEDAVIINESVDEDTNINTTGKRE